MASGAISLTIMLLVALLADAAVRPRRARLRHWRGLVMNGCFGTALFGLWLAISGSAPVAGVIATALTIVVVLASNAKHAVLGEPLLFCDLTLFAALVHHPRFYFGAVPMRQRLVAMLAVPLLLAVLAALFEPEPLPHLVGLALMLLGTGMLMLLLADTLRMGAAREPDIAADLARFGLVASLLLYWRRWRATPDPPPCPPLPPASAKATPPLIVVVQCESFADPVALTGDAARALPGLAAARANALCWGDLQVSGFGAYTMRTEYGVLFGREEAALGFRRYNPYLSALGEASYALPMRLRSRGYRSVFAHPHDLRFYGRDTLLPAIGFDVLVGEESFAAPPPGTGPYVDDRTLGAMLGEQAAAATGPTLLYAVTMENHGPWDAKSTVGGLSNLAAYLAHLRSSDAMLSALMARLAGLRRPALLVFFGDHRPSIPGVTRPGGARHTPYVMLRFDGEGRAESGASAEMDRTPAQLHHAILAALDG